MITTRAVPVPLSHHHRRVTQIPAALTNDFADPLPVRTAPGMTITIPGGRRQIGQLRRRPRSAARY